MNVIVVATRIYERLVRVYPQTFREDYAEEIVWYFEDLCHDTLRKKGHFGLVMLWFNLLPDWGLTVVKEHLLQVGYRGAINMQTAEFNKQYTSTLALFSRGLRDGYNVAQCIEIIVEHAPEPTRSVFQKVLDRVQAGDTFADALNALSEETKSPYADRVITVLTEQQKNGGNLADQLDTLNREIFPKLGDIGWAKQVDLEDGYDMDEQYPFKD